MKEAIAKIASAWSVAFIVTAVGMITPDHQASAYDLIVLVPAITGAGWLAYRSSRKSTQAASEKGGE